MRTVIGLAVASTLVGLPFSGVVAQQTQGAPQTQGSQEQAPQQQPAPSPSSPGAQTTGDIPTGMGGGASGAGVGNY